jgi:hypothetical protein
MIAVVYERQTRRYAGLQEMKIMMKVEFWYVWARIAIAEADRSISARARFGTSANSAGDNRALDEELNSGVTAVCASAFSLETLTLLLAPIVMPNAAVQGRCISMGLIH